MNGAGDPLLLIERCYVATMDAAGSEHEDGHLVVDGTRLAAVGPGSAPAELIEQARAAGRHVERIDGEGLLATPGLVNCHHHLYQSLTRGWAQEATLFEWLVELYPVWSGIDAELTGVAARAGLASLVLSGCTTTTDHHYLFPRDAGDLLGAEIGAARELGLRFHPCRGSMDLGESHGGLPPDRVIEDRDDILAATAAAIDAHHDPAADSMVRIAIAPCSPFSVTAELMREAAELARSRGVRLHTHLAETAEEEAFCLERFGVRPVDYVAELGWLGDDVWLAHCIHLDAEEVGRFGASGTGVAHCPSSNARLGAGIAPVAALLAVGAPVGLGVDGAASNEASELNAEVRQALLLARLRGGPAALTARQALQLATREGARCLGRQDDLGSLEPGKLADIALWDMTDLGQAGMADPVAALVLGPPRPAEAVLVNGRRVVEAGTLRTGDAAARARELARGAREMERRAGRSPMRGLQAARAGGTA